MDSERSLFALSVRFVVYMLARLGYGIISTLVERLAASDAFDGHPRSATRTMKANRFVPVLRAGWIVPAIAPESGRKHRLVGANGPHEQASCR